MKRLKLMDSGAIHLIGNRLIEAATHNFFFLLCECTAEVNTDQKDLYVSTFVIFLLVHVARKAEVAELDAIRRRHQDVSHCNVSTTQKGVPFMKQKIRQLTKIAQKLSVNACRS